MEQSKACKVCLQIKPISEFHKHSVTKDGYRGKCKTCCRIYDQNWRIKNPEKVKENNKRHKELNPDYMTNYRANNRERIKETAKKWWARNPSYLKEWLEKHPHYLAMQSAKYRATLKANGIYEITAFEIYKMYNKPCFYCNATFNIQLDHVIPVARTGHHSVGNLVPACKPCNTSKSDSTIMEWRMRGGFIGLP